MSDFKLRIRRYDPDSDRGAYWDEHSVDLEGHRSVLEGILQAKASDDGSYRNSLLMPSSYLRFHVA